METQVPYGRCLQRGKVAIKPNGSASAIPALIEHKPRQTCRAIPRYEGRRLAGGEFVRVEQGCRDTPQGPCARCNHVRLPLLQASARTRQDSLILAFWGSRGTTGIRGRSFNAHAQSNPGSSHSQKTATGATGRPATVYPCRTAVLGLTCKNYTGKP